jgi:predicted nucleic acid-binding protein
MSLSLKNTSAEVLFLDANILLEIILAREKETVVRQFIEEQTGTLCISTLTAHLIVHFGESIVALPVLRKFLADYTVLALDSADFEWAFTNVRNQDFEDALQLAVAIRNGCNQFITFDKRLVTTYNDLVTIETRLLS